MAPGGRFVGAAVKAGYQGKLKSQRIEASGSRM